MSANRKRFHQQIGKIILRGNVLEVNCAFHLFVVNMMIFNINMFQLLPYNSQVDQFDGTLVVASDGYRPINYLYCHCSCSLLHHTSEPEAFPGGIRTGNIFGLKC